MTKAEIIQLLDGEHERHGGRVALTIHVLTFLSAIAIALETEPGIPALIQRSLYHFEVFLIVVFTVEYLLRLYASPSRLSYALSGWGIIDLFAILPAIALLTPEWQVVRAFRLVRLFKLFRGSQSFNRLAMALRSVQGELMIFGVASALMLYVSAVGIYLFEHDTQPEVFTSILTSLWWAVASFTTVGYGDMIPITPGGRLFTTVVLFVGLGIIAVPAAIVTTALLEAETNIRKRRTHSKPKPEETEHGE
ncbi:MAG: ion transporter [Maritimibacter sp.]